MADLAVVIVAHNSRQWLEPCLRSVIDRRGDVDVDIVVVDSGSSDGSADYVRENVREARVVSCENRGFAHANNRGLETIDARWALLLNPDTEIVAGTLAEVVAYGDARPAIGCIGVRQVFATGELQFSIRRFPGPVRMLGDAMASESWPVRPAAFGHRVLDPATYERETRCDWVSGSFMCVRTEALAEVGLLDERYFLYCEEPDLCFRLERAGWQVVHSPVMTIVHHGGNESGDPRHAAQLARSQRLYLEKNRSGLVSLAGGGALALGYGLRWLLGTRPGPTQANGRAAARAALRSLLGIDPPPFGH